MKMTTHKRLTKKERDLFLKSVEELLKTYDIKTHVNISYESQYYSENIPLRDIDLAFVVDNPKEMHFDITISGIGKVKKQ